MTVSNIGAYHNIANIEIGGLGTVRLGSGDTANVNITVTSGRLKNTDGSPSNWTVIGDYEIGKSFTGSPSADVTIPTFVWLLEDKTPQIITVSYHDGTDSAQRTVLVRYQWQYDGI